MSGGLDVLALREEDVSKFLAAGTHLGSTSVDYQMLQYVYKRKTDGECHRANHFHVNFELWLVILFWW